MVLVEVGQVETEAGCKLDERVLECMLTSILAGLGATVELGTGIGEGDAGTVVVVGVEDLVVVELFAADVPWDASVFAGSGINIGLESTMKGSL